jgi:chromosome segregation ATPase
VICIQLVQTDDITLTGVRGRVMDLCKPTARKYETAVSVVLGRNIDAIVVDEERTAIECIEVSGDRFHPLATIHLRL